MWERDGFAASCLAQCRQIQEGAQQPQQERFPSPSIQLDSSSRAGSTDAPASLKWRLPGPTVVAAATKRVRFELVPGGEGLVGEGLVVVHHEHQGNSSSRGRTDASSRGRTDAGSPPETPEDQQQQQQQRSVQDLYDMEQHEGGAQDEGIMSAAAADDDVAGGRRQVLVRRVGVRAQARKRMFKKATRRRRPQRAPLA
jgi:hypothetical protein